MNSAQYGDAERIDAHVELVDNSTVPKGAIDHWTSPAVFDGQFRHTVTEYTYCFNLDFAASIS